MLGIYNETALIKVDSAAKLRVKFATKMSFLLACLGLILKWRRRSHRKHIKHRENRYKPGEASICCR